MNGLELLALTHVRRFARQWDQPTADDWAAELAAFPLFTGVSKRRLRKLAAAGTFADVAPGAPIVFAGDRDTSLHIIVWGHARTTSPTDRRVLRAGDHFGESAMLEGVTPATIVAMSDVRVLKLPPNAVRNLARRHPAITLKLLQSLTARLRHLERQVASAAAG